MVALTFLVALILGLGIQPSQSLRYTPEEEDHNLNTNTSADNPLDYWGEWKGHEYMPSPKNWRFPFYTLFLDRWVNGNPSNDNANGTLFEQDIYSTQFRHGGDIQGLVDSLDYIQGMGIKGIYIAGSPFINQPWQSDSYSPLDLTLLDYHFGNITEWRRATDEIHRRGMYVLMDNTVATMGDLIGFEGYLNESTPFDAKEHNYVWKSSRRYLDFSPSNTYNDTCEFPRFWNETGYPVEQEVNEMFKGCYDGDFDQFGDTEAFGVYPDYRRQLTKFASVQDRLREWVPSVRERLEHFSCLAIHMLDIDGYRFDKAIQVTVDASGQFSSHLRKCARQVGKDNFFLPGEITGGNNMASVYLGRGRQPNQYSENLTEAMLMTDKSPQKHFLRESDQGALDAGAFHYSVYRFLTRFLGMDGNLEAGYDLPMDWIEAWNQMILTNDFINPNTGIVDPRHMYGTTNQDVFRWPAIHQGIERFLLGQFITTLLLPGIPLLLWGEEVAFSILENTADNYIFGRQSMSPSPAWYMHGCYKGNSTQYYQMPLESALTGCEDIANSWDHRDPAHPIRNIIRSLYSLREKFDVLNDGFYLDKLSNQTEMIQFPGSNTTKTETGLWSVRRAPFAEFQDFGVQTDDMWLVYHNRNETTRYTFDCSSKESAIVAPYASGTTVKNLLYPHDEIELIDGPTRLQLNGSKELNGCVKEMTFAPYEFRVYTPMRNFAQPSPVITKFLPGHDTPILSTASGDELNTVNISFHFSAEMDCKGLTSLIKFNSSTAAGVKPRIDTSSVECKNLAKNETVPYVGAVASAWSWSATLKDVADGIHQIVIPNAESVDGDQSTNSTDNFLFRIGKADNPIVHPNTGNYSRSILSTDDDGTNWLSHKAHGADMWRYSLNWGSSWSNWQSLSHGTDRLENQKWTGTDKQKWEGNHVMVQYWSRLLGSSSFIQHGDSDYDHERRFPHLFAAGPFNKYGFDAGLRNTFKFNSDGQWNWHFMDEWPAVVQLNVWGVNPDGQPDQSFVYGDVDGDGVLDRLNPSSLIENTVNITQIPPYPHVAYRVALNDANLRYELIPTGNQWIQLALFITLWVVPILTGFFAVFVFMGTFYKIKYVKRGVEKITMRKRAKQVRKSMQQLRCISGNVNDAQSEVAVKEVGPSEVPDPSPRKRRMLVATIEHNIDDWNIKVKIGGLGVMAELMSKSLRHQDLIWVVPCVGDIEYPDHADERADPMEVTILGRPYLVDIHYHRLGNITFVLLDAPIFRVTTKADPYPPRMDDMDSAIYYSTWNQCIAQTIMRFEVDLYHINDYHGAVAPLYLLPETVPCCMSLHNAEFQGLWQLRTEEERTEVCEVFNLPQDIVKRYVQFGSVFNLLHAGASYLRIHQSGYGAVGVSKKYGDRSFSRYPIFWGLSHIGQLPNPDPSDLADWDKSAVLKKKEVKVDEEYEAQRGELRMQAQAWAGLEIDPTADLFVFVGRWSEQKGVDLIADIFPSILEEYPKTQLICVGPIIDLYGKFSALKLSKLMEMYPSRVFSRPEFTLLPPCVHTGAEFALIPSRDEPFGLVAVEFGRKGALGVGARVGGLGQMPGWWYTIESTSTTHLLKQFKGAITAALESGHDDRAMMRAWSAKQRFPVAQWLEGLEKLQRRAIKAHSKTKRRNRKSLRFSVVDIGGDMQSAQSPNTPNTPGKAEGSRSASPDSRPLSMQMLSLPHTNSNLSNLTIPSVAGGSSGLNTPTHFAFDSDIESGFDRSDDDSPRTSALNSRVSSVVNLHDIVGERKDFALQQVDPNFTDADGRFFSAFERRLSKLTAKNSTTENCIEEYLIKSERQWFDRRHDAKIGSTFFAQSNSSTTLNNMPKKQSPLAREMAITEVDDVERRGDNEKTPGPSHNEFYFGENYIPPTGIRRWLQIRLGQWPVYSFLLALGQIIASNSYQITLLSGEVGQSASKLYTIAGIYLGFSIFWGLLSRYMRLVYVLSTPFALYGAAFILIGASPFAKNLDTRYWIQNVATGVYAAASASGSLFFAFNFGDEGGAPITTWIWRACCIQGVQHAYTLALWFWGSFISATSETGESTYRLSALPVLFPVTLVIAILLWIVGILLFIGLPTYYRQMPAEVPKLYKAIFKRRTTCWFFVAVILQNYFLSATYGRNWFYLFSSKHISAGVVVGLAAFFLFGVWALFLAYFAYISKRHPWWLPMFALGLGAPRWAQMLWGTSSFGLYLPWAGSHVLSAILARCLWLWLGLLDAVQNAGIGMILMVTLTRVHVAVALMIAQVIGSAATMAARASAPNRIGPGDIFPDFSEGLGEALSKAWFWVGLFTQLLICAGFFKFFRKEQISKP